MSKLALITGAGLFGLLACAPASDDPSSTQNVAGSGGQGAGSGGATSGSFNPASVTVAGNNLAIDTNGDGLPDAVPVDTNGDLVNDAVVIDSNGDGVGDTIIPYNFNAGVPGGVGNIAGNSGVAGGANNAGAGGTLNTAGAAGSNAGGANNAGAGGTSEAGAGGASAGGSAGAGGAGEPPPMLEIDPGRMNREDIQFNVTDADATASGFHGGNQLASFDGSKTAQGYLVITMGGIGGGPHTGGAYQWAVGRGFHAFSPDIVTSPGGEGNGGLIYAESWSGQDLTGVVNVTPQNGAMGRTKAALAYLNTVDPGADWDYYLDSNGEVLWNRVIIWGYSWGGQAAFAASKFVAAHRIIPTSAPNIPTEEAEAAWITELPNLTDPANCYAINDGEDEFWAVLTSAGWIGPAVRIFDGGALLVQPPFNGSHMLDMAGGHTEFCSLPNAAYDAACDFAFGTIP